MTHSPSTNKDNITLPLILSVFLHSAVVAVLLSWQSVPPTPTPVALETTLIGNDEFHDIMGQIAQNAIQATSGDEGADSTTNNAPTPTASPHIQTLNDMLAQREAQYQEQMAQYAALLDEEATKEIQQLQEFINQQYEEEQTKLTELRQAYQNIDEQTRQNQIALDEARAARDAKIQQAEEQKRKMGGQSGSIAQGVATITAQSGNNGNKNTQSGGVSKSEISGQIASLINKQWHPTHNKTERLNAKIRVDASGNVLSVSVSGGTEALRNSLERAIYNASPLSPIIGTEYRSLDIAFNTRPNG